MEGIEDVAYYSTDLGRAFGLAATGLLIKKFTGAMIVGDAACAAYGLSS